MIKIKINRTNKLRYLEHLLSILREKEISIVEGEVVNLGLIKKQILLLEEILAYVDSYSWLQKKDTIERVEVLRRNNYDYKAMQEELGISYDVATSTVCYINSILRGKIGECLELVEKGEVEDARLIFYINTNQFRLNDLIVTPINKILPNPKESNLNIEDCVDEIRYLQRYTKAEVERQLQGLNTIKLAYLHQLLVGNDSSKTMEKINLIKKIKERVE